MHAVIVDVKLNLKTFTSPQRNKINYSKHRYKHHTQKNEK